MPLFPTYVFCRFNSSAVGKAVATPGVTRIVGFGGRFAEVKDDEIEALQLMSQSSLFREPWTYIPAGTLVQVETGPLAGTRGIFCSGNEKRRLVISVTLLQRSVAVQLDENTVISLVEASNTGEGGRGDKAATGDQSDLALKLMKKSGSRSA
jgi:transcription antitermination factor NusG